MSRNLVFFMGYGASALLAALSGESSFIAAMVVIAVLYHTQEQSS